MANCGKQKTICNTFHTLPGMDRRNGCRVHDKHFPRHGRETECDCAGRCWRGSRRRLQVPLLTACVPWDPQLSGPDRHRVMAELFSHPTIGTRRKPSPQTMRSAGNRFRTRMGDSSCASSGSGTACSGNSGSSSSYKTAAHFFHGGIRGKLWRGVAAVMVEERARDAVRCGEGKDFRLVHG